MAILAVIVGLTGGLGAVGFRLLINLFQTIAYGSPGELLEVVKTIPWTIKVGIPAAGGCWSDHWYIFWQERPRVTEYPK